MIFWYEADPSTNDTLWHGSSIWLLSLMRQWNKEMPRFQVVNEDKLPEVNASLDSIYYQSENCPSLNKSHLHSRKKPPLFSVQQAVVDGVADLDLNNYGHNYKTTPYYDYVTQPISYTSAAIWYAKSYRIKGDPVRGIFDWNSYGMITLGLLGLAALIFLALRREDDNLSPVYVAVWCLGHVFGQGLPQTFDDKRSKSTNSTVLLFIMSTFFLRLMYLSMVITNITAQEKGPTVDTLEQLANEPHRKVTMIQNIGETWKDLDSIKKLRGQIVYL